MIADGGRRIREIAIVGGRQAPDRCSPCGGCRQRIAEFADAGTRVWFTDEYGKWRAYSVDDLLPAGFRLRADAEQP